MFFDISNQPSMIDYQHDHREDEMSEIQIIIGDRGVKKVLLVTGKRQPTPIGTLALFSRLEPLIESFKENVKEAVSAHCGKRTQGE